MAGRMQVRLRSESPIPMFTGGPSPQQDVMFVQVDQGPGQQFALANPPLAQQFASANPQLVPQFAPANPQLVPQFAPANPQLAPQFAYAPPPTQPPAAQFTIVAAQGPPQFAPGPGIPVGSPVAVPGMAPDCGPYMFHPGYGQHSYYPQGAEDEEPKKKWYDCLGLCVKGEKKE